jgi:hypothetical protein
MSIVGYETAQRSISAHRDLARASDKLQLSRGKVIAGARRAQATNHHRRQQIRWGYFVSVQLRLRPAK